MESLVKDAGRRVFLILDNLRVDHSKPVEAWLESNKEKMEVFYLPSYSPHLNPEERLNADLKQACAGAHERKATRSGQRSHDAQ